MRGTILKAPVMCATRSGPTRRFSSQPMRSCGPSLSASAGRICGPSPHGVEVPIEDLFWPNLGLRGGPAPVRRYLPELLDLVTSGTIEPGLVFDLTLPMDQSPEGYRAMDDRRAIKVLLRP